VSLAWVAAAGIVGAALGPLLRARIFRHAMPAGQRPAGQPAVNQPAAAQPVAGQPPARQPPAAQPPRERPPAEQPVRHACPACATLLVPSGPRGILALLPPSGRCPACRARLGPPAGAVEVAGAAAFALLAGHAGSVLQLVASCWVAAFGVALAFIDLAAHRLPNRLTLPAYSGALLLFGTAGLADHRLGTLRTAVVCGLAMVACYLALTLIAPAGMGWGDGKLALSVGILLGWSGWSATAAGTAAGFLLAGLYAAGVLMLGKATRKDHIPHGPFLLLGALSAIALTG
jgi:leader peptidase (prepilin peptidase)/N-methyltransferase